MTNTVTTTQSYQLVHASYEVRNAQATAQATKAKLDADGDHDGDTGSSAATESAEASEYAFDVYA